MIELDTIDSEFKFHLIPQIYTGKVIQQFKEIFAHSKQKIESFQTYCKMIQSENTFDMYSGLVGLRYILFAQADNLQQEAIEEIVYELNTLKYIAHIIGHNENQLIIYEALWILARLIQQSTQITDKIIENDSINCLIKRFSQGDYADIIIEQVCLIINNVTSKSVDHQKHLAKLGILNILNKFAIGRVNNYENVDLFELLVYSISHCLQVGHVLHVKDIAVLLEIFKKWLQWNLSPNILLQICFSIAVYLQYHPTQIQTIIDSGIIPRLIRLVEINDNQIFFINIEILISILRSHQTHQEYLYGIGIIPLLGKLIKKYCEFSSFLFTSQIKMILSVFKIISLSKYLRSYLFNSYELDQLLLLINLDRSTIEVQVQDQIHSIIENLIEGHQDITSVNLIQKKKMIDLCQIYASRDAIEQQRSEICEIILDICDKYLTDKKYDQFNDELKLVKTQIKYKLKKFEE